MRPRPYRLSSLVYSLFVVHALACSLSAQTTSVLKDKNNRLIDSLKVPSGKTFTIESGATINATGATITGFTASSDWADITGKPSTFPPEAHNQAWSTITSTPTTLAGYGIADAITAATAATTYQPLNATLTSISGLAHAGGVLTNDGTGTVSWTGVSNGGLGADDNGLLPRFSNFLSNPGSLVAKTLFAYNANIDNATDYYSQLESTGQLYIRTGAYTTSISSPSNEVSITATWPITNGTILTAESPITLAQLAQTSATSGQVIAWNGTEWAPATPASSGATLGANTFTGLQQFTGTTHAGLRLNNLTTTQRDALASPTAGMVIWNTTDSRMQLHNGTAWTSGMVRLSGDTMTGPLGITSGTVTTSTPPLNITQTYNGGSGVTHRGVEIAVTNTSSNSASTLFRVLGGAAGASERLSVRQDGYVAITQAVNNSPAMVVSGLDRNWVFSFAAGGNGMSFDSQWFDHRATSANFRQLNNNGTIEFFRLTNTAAAGVMVLRGGASAGAALQMREMATAPASPSADEACLYFEDNGSGKTRLVVKYSDGTTTVLATQP